jgi:hypothetical protein
MATTARATLSANNDVCGPIVIGPRRTGVFRIEVTGTITVTVQTRVGTTWFAVKKADESTDAAYTADSAGEILAPGEYRLIASGVAAGSAACRLSQS